MKNAFRTNTEGVLKMFYGRLSQHLSAGATAYLLKEMSIPL